MAKNKFYDEDEDEELYFGQYRPLRTRGLEKKEKRREHDPSARWDED